MDDGLRPGDGPAFRRTRKSRTVVRCFLTLNVVSTKSLYRYLRFSRPEASVSLLDAVRKNLIVTEFAQTHSRVRGYSRTRPKTDS